MSKYVPSPLDDWKYEPKPAPTSDPGRWSVENRNPAGAWESNPRVFATQAEARADAEWFTCETRIVVPYSDPVNFRYDFKTRRPVRIDSADPHPTVVPGRGTAEERLKAIAAIDELREQIQERRRSLESLPEGWQPPVRPAQPPVRKPFDARRWAPVIAFLTVVAIAIGKCAIGTPEFSDVSLSNGTVTFKYHASSACSALTFQYDFKDASGNSLGVLSGDTRSVTSGEDVDVTATGTPPVGATSVNIGATCGDTR